MLFSVLLLVFGLDVYTSESELHISLTGIEPSKGMIYISVYNSKSGFLKPEMAIYKLTIDARQSTHELLKLQLVNCPKIAIACYQDINGNQKLDTNALGIPTEPYAFSNNARGKWKKPTWDDAAINWKLGFPLVLNLHYW